MQLIMITTTTKLMAFRPCDVSVMYTTDNNTVRIDLDNGQYAEIVANKGENANDMFMTMFRMLNSAVGPAAPKEEQPK